MEIHVSIINPLLEALVAGGPKSKAGGWMKCTLINPGWPRVPGTVFLVTTSDSIGGIGHSLQAISIDGRAGVIHVKTRPSLLTCRGRHTFPASRPPGDQIGEGNYCYYWRAGVRLFGDSWLLAARWCPALDCDWRLCTLYKDDQRNGSTAANKNLYDDKWIIW